MIVGAAQVDVTPTGIVELSGYAARTQPMVGVLDPIYAQALYLECGGKKLLWLSLDVLALSHAFVASFRRWARNELSIPDILLSATHTHAAPAVVELTGCGRCDEAYLHLLQERSRKAAREAVERAEKAQMVFAQVELPLAVDRRERPSAHVDSTLSAIGWKRANGQFIATLLNYPMHPVSLGHVNRQVSADWPACNAVFRVIATVEQISAALVRALQRSAATGTPDSEARSLARKIFANSEGIRLYAALNSVVAERALSIF